MKKRDPYTTLGVPKNADTAAIRAAHRRAAKKHHPDAGGKTEEMVEVNRAYMILSDPAKRQHYDETGETETRNNDLSQLISLYVAACEVVVPGESPLVLLARRLDSDRQKALQAEQELKQKAAKMHRMAAKTRKRAKGPNLLANALTGHGDGLERKAAAARSEADRVERMSAMLKDYDFEREAHDDMDQINQLLTAFGQTGKSPFFAKWT